MIEVAHYIVNLGCHSYDSFTSISNIKLKLTKLIWSYINAAGLFPLLRLVLTESLNWNLCIFQKGVKYNQNINL